MIRTKAEGEIIRRMLEAAGDARRFEMLCWLRGRRLTVKEIVNCTGLAQPLVSHHLAALRDSGLVGVEPKGRRRYHFLASDNPLAVKVLAVLDQLQERSLPTATAPRAVAATRPGRVRRRSSERAVRPASKSTAGFLVGDGTDAVAQPTEVNLMVEPVGPLDLLEGADLTAPTDALEVVAEAATPHLDLMDSPEVGPEPEAEKIASEGEPAPKSDPKPEAAPEVTPEPDSRNDIEDFLL